MLLTGLLVFISILLSGLSVWMFRLPKTGLRLLLSFSGAFLFALSLLHLIPHLYEGGDHRIGMFILAGFFLQLLLEYITQGIEHGHIHVHEHHEHGHDHTHAHLPFGIIAGLCIHSFLEGMPLGSQTTAGDNLRPFLTGIVLHNIPIAVAFMSLMLHLKLQRMKALVFLSVFALMTPLGMLTTHLLGVEMGEDDPLFKIIMAMVVGIFLHISTTILFETSENHRFNAIKFVTMLVGVCTAWLLTL